MTLRRSLSVIITMRTSLRGVLEVLITVNTKNFLILWFQRALSPREQENGRTRVEGGLSGTWSGSSTAGGDAAQKSILGKLAPLRERYDSIECVVAGANHHDAPR